MTNGEIYFTQSDYHNGIFQQVFSKNSFDKNIILNIDTKPIIKNIILKPNWLKKIREYEGFLLQVFEENNEKKNISFLLKIPEERIIDILIKKYTAITKGSNQKKKLKILKYRENINDPEELISNLPLPKYEISPIDLTFLAEELNITIKLITNKYNTKNLYEEIVLNEGMDHKILLFHYREITDEKGNFVYKLGYIDLKD